MSKEVLAILCGDLHLSHAVPPCRSDEPHWYDTMAKALAGLRGLETVHSAPIICSGDVFDRWQSCAELINFAIEWLPQMYAIPGQHDLPNHNYGEINRSAYQTLEKAGVITSLIPGTRTAIRDYDRCFYVTGFPWGFDVKPLETHTDAIHLAVIHAYCWQKGATYPGAPDSGHIGNFKKQLEGYDAAVFGDNHKGFLAGNVLNCGGFMRRTSDQEDYEPQVGLLYDDGTIGVHKLDISQDRFRRVEKALPANAETDASEFLAELNALGVDSLDFNVAIRRYLDKEKPGRVVEALVLGAIDG